MDIVVIVILILLVASYCIKALTNFYTSVSAGFLWTLLFIHFIMTTVYIVYAINSTSDSFSYYRESLLFRTWVDAWGIGTKFIHFIAWPFTSVFGLSYLATMLVFSFFGLVGVVLFYISCKENVCVPTIIGSFSYVELLFILPNLHFWTSSLGKGSVIVFGLGLFNFALSRFNRRKLLLIIGSAIIFFVRPHIILAIIISIMIGLLLTNVGIKKYIRWVLFSAALLAYMFISNQVFDYLDTDNINLFDANSFSHKASELGKASSGININDYNPVIRIFFFWFRPLFFDADSVIGIFASIENFIYLLMFLLLLKWGILSWKSWNGWFRINLLIFIFASFALAQVSGNLGLAMRQKSQLMPFYFIVFCKILYYKNQYSKNSVYA